MKKIEKARASIAQALLGLEVGDTLPRTVDLARIAEVGSGTVQGALESLESDGTISTSAHGSLGRKLLAIDVPLLWQSSGRGAITGVLPLPESREFAGIATALSTEFERVGIALQLLFRQGNLTRIAQVASGIVEFSLMSRRAAELAPELLSFRALGEYTYYARDAVVVITPRDHKRTRTSLQRIAIDRCSSDHTALTIREFPEAELVDMHYLFIPEAVAKGEVDGAIWHRTTASPLMTATGLSIHELMNTSGGDDLLEAVIAWRSADPGVGRIIEGTLSATNLCAIQQEVMDGVRVPQF